MWCPSHLVETLGGMELLGPGMELHGRWRWQQLYGAQIQAGFRNTVTSTAAGSRTLNNSRVSLSFGLDDAGAEG